MCTNPLKARSTCMPYIPIYRVFVLFSGFREMTTCGHFFCLVAAAGAELVEALGLDQ